MADIVRRILVVEDAEIMASGMRATVSQDRDNEIVAIVPSVELAVAAISEARVDVLLADIRLTDGTAFDLLKILAARGPIPPTLIVSSFDHAQYVDAALRMGAAGYLLKTAPASELLAAIRAVADGGWAFDRELVLNATRAKQLGLTVRDRQVIERIVAGRSNDEIGSDLGISRKTVEAHVSKLLTRFDVATRVELVGRAEREHWLDAPLTSAATDNADT